MPLPVPRYFPPPNVAASDGLLGYDTRLTRGRMLDAYKHGIFPWPHQEGETWYTGWYSPDPRAILPLDGVHIPRRLQRKLNVGRFHFTWNRHFPEVLQQCAHGSKRAHRGTWLSDELQAVIKTLHQEGFAHSVEVYDAEADHAFCGGLYGVTWGGASFSAESMFHSTSDASKAAVVALVRLLQTRGFTLLDIQQSSPHMQNLGAVEISRDEYLKRLAKSNKLPHSPISRQESPIPYHAIATTAS